MNKLVAWGTIIGIVGVIHSITTSADNTTQNIHGNKNTVIGETHAPLTINYGSDKNTNNSSDQYVLKTATIIFAEPSLKILMDKSKYVCEDVISGTRIELMGDVAKDSGITYRKIRVLTGDCEGKTGWVSSEVIGYQ